MYVCVYVCAGFVTAAVKRITRQRQRDFAPPARAHAKAGAERRRWRSALAARSVLCCGVVCYLSTLAWADTESIHSRSGGMKLERD